MALEIDVARRETKYLINDVIASRVRAALDAVLMPLDPMGVPDGYMVRSLYFDTAFDGDYNDKVDGLENRRKIRLRVYSPDANEVKLELKQKRGVEQWKHSIFLTRDDASLLLSGDFVKLKERLDSPFARSLLTTMEVEGYAPKTIVEFRRVAYMLETDNTRVTIDSGLRATEACFNIFSPELAMYPIDGPCILEVKYTHFLLSYIRSALTVSGMMPISAGKYCLGRRIAYY